MCWRGFRGRTMRVWLATVKRRQPLPKLRNVLQSHRVGRLSGGADRETCLHGGALRFAPCALRSCRGGMADAILSASARVAPRSSHEAKECSACTMARGMAGARRVSFRCPGRRGSAPKLMLLGLEKGSTTMLVRIGKLGAVLAIAFATAAGLSGCVPGPAGYAGWASYRQQQGDHHAQRSHRNAEMAQVRLRSGDHVGAQMWEAAAEDEAMEAQQAHNHATRDRWLSLLFH